MKRELKKQQPFLGAAGYGLSTLTQSHTSWAASASAKFLTRCLICCSLEARKLQRRKTGSHAKAILNLPFSRKKKNEEAFLPRTALGQGYACVHIRTHTHTHTHCPPLCFENIHKCSELDLWPSEAAAKSFPSKAARLTNSVCRQRPEPTGWSQDAKDALRADLTQHGTATTTRPSELLVDSSALVRAGGRDCP